jgi:hypothetical protein
MDNTPICRLFADQMPTYKFSQISKTRLGQTDFAQMLALKTHQVLV